MSFDRLEFAELLARAQADIESRLPDATPQLRRSLLGIIAYMHSGAIHGEYGYLDWMAKQLMPDTAEREHLERWAGIWSITRKAARAATGLVTFTGTDESVIDPGTVVTRADGATYATTAEAVITGGSVQVAAAASETGADGNADAGLALTLVSPVAGIQSDAQATDGMSGGADEEVDTALLARLLTRIRQPPHGGARFDYETWALEVPGVTRAWCVAMELGAGTVTVRFMTDDTTANGIPTVDDVAAVQAYIDSMRPVTAEVFVLAPAPVSLDLAINLSPNTSAVKAAIEAEIIALIRREAEPGGAILVSHLREAISTAPGEFDHALVSPVADVDHATGEIAVPGTIIWGDM